MNSTAKSPVPHILLLWFITMGLCLFSPRAWGQEENKSGPVKVTLKKKSMDAKGVRAFRLRVEKAKPRLKIQGIKTEARTKSQVETLKIYDQLLGSLDELKAIMDALDKGNQEAIKDWVEKKKRLIESTATAKKLLNAETIPLGTIDDQTMEELTAKDTSLKLDETRAQEETKLAEKIANDRAKSFDKNKETLSERIVVQKSLTEELAKEGLGAERKLQVQLSLQVIECQIQINELKRKYHSKFKELDRARKEWAAAWLENATILVQLSAKKLAAASVQLQAKLKKEAQLQKEAAEKKRLEAARENSKAKKALLEFEIFVTEMGVAEKKEKQLYEEVVQRKNNILAEIESIELRTKNIATLLPPEEDLDAFKESYLQQEISTLGDTLDDHREDHNETSQFLLELRRTASTTRFDLSALKKQISLHARSAGDPNGSKKAINSKIGLIQEWSRLQRKWQENYLAIKNFKPTEKTPQTEASEMAAMQALLPEWKTLWDQASEKLPKIIDRRLAKFVEIFKETKVCLDLNEKPVALLEEREQQLISLAFWLKEDPPFGDIRRKMMAKELQEIKKKNSDFGTEFFEDLYSRIRGFAGVFGMLLIAAACLFFGYRRSKFKAIEGARVAHGRTKDPLYRLLSMSAWLMAEIGHYVLAISGIMFLWRGPFPADPIASTILTVLLIAALRLTLLRILVYAEVSDEKLSKLLFIDARRMVKIALLGFFILFPISSFFAKSGATALDQATRLIASTWLFLVAFRMMFRRDILLLLLPSKDIGALSRGLKLLVHYFWPLLTAFIAVIVYLKFNGYRNASQLLAYRSILAAVVLVVSLVLFQFLQAYVDSKTAVLVGDKDGNQKSHSETKAERRHRATVRRVFSLPLLLVSTIATIVAMAWAVGITPKVWERWRENEIMSGADPIAVGDFTSALLIFSVGYVLSCTFRDLFVIGGLSKSTEDHRGTRYAWGTLTFYIAMCLTLIFGLRSLSIDLSKYSWLLGTAGVALGFGMTEILSNFVCGIILFVERPVQVGDIITVGDVEGDVRRISIRSTIVQTRDGVSIILPNRRLIEADVVNWSHSDPLTRLKISVGAAYGSDVALVKKALLEVAEREGRILSRPHPEVSFIEFGESELSFQLLTWLPTPDITVHRRVRSDMNSAVDAAFRRFGIEIPFPQRDLHLKTTPETIEKAKLEEEEKEAEKAAEDENKNRGISLP